MIDVISRIWVSCENRLVTLVSEVTWHLLSKVIVNMLRIKNVKKKILKVL